jgi:hypothetical protein
LSGALERAVTEKMTERIQSLEARLKQLKATAAQ